MPLASRPFGRHGSNFPHLVSVGISIVLIAAVVSTRAPGGGVFHTSPRRIRFRPTLLVILLRSRASSVLFPEDSVGTLSKFFLVSAVFVSPELGSRGNGNSMVFSLLSV